MRWPASWNWLMPPTSHIAALAALRPPEDCDCRLFWSQGSTSSPVLCLWGFYSCLEHQQSSCWEKFWYGKPGYDKNMFVYNILLILTHHLIELIFISLFIFTCAGEDGSVSGLSVAKDLGYVQHIGFNASDRLISACIGKEVWVLNIQVWVS